MSSLPDSGLSIRDLGVLFDQSPIAMVFNDRELRTRCTNAAFRRQRAGPVHRRARRAAGQDIGTGMSRLARTLAAGPVRSLRQLCDSILASLAPRPRDDIALLLARTTAQTARTTAQRSLSLSESVRARWLRRLDNSTRSWLR
jgi:hypothetical protein